MADANGPQGLLTLVCITCGNEKHFVNRPPSSVQCEKCKGRVFRNYFTPVQADEATVSQLEQTARSLSYDDESSTVSEDELRDLDESSAPERKPPPLP